MDKQKITSKPEMLVSHWIQNLYGFKPNIIKKLSGYDDVNYLIRDQHEIPFVVKLSPNTSLHGHISAQHRILDFLQLQSRCAEAFPKVIPGVDKNNIYEVSAGDQNFLLRVLTYLEGDLMDNQHLTPVLLDHLGSFLASLDQCLLSLELPEIRNHLSLWDLQHALHCLKQVDAIADPHYSRLIHYFMQQYHIQVKPRSEQLPMGVIHGDANDQNLLVRGEQISGLIDFGDATYSHLVNELAVAVTYVMLEAEDPLEAACYIVEGYHNTRPLVSTELEVFYYLVAARLCTSLCFSSQGQRANPDNQYITLHQAKVTKMLDWLIAQNPLRFETRLKQACGLEIQREKPIKKLALERARHLSHALSLSYKEPLNITRGALQYLYDARGRTFLDAVNNISHVGHCHPAVVEAASAQMARLNTNTRYLYQMLNEYAAQICDRLPDPLSVIFFVNSGSEANELALRLARAYTGYRDMLVIDGAYHGNSTATMEISPYKYQNPGGVGKKDYIHELSTPDLFRGNHQESGEDPLTWYMQEQQEIIDWVVKSRGGFAGFIAESLLGCAGQIELPSGYLKGTYAQVRKHHGVCIADEVQVGFGRVGTHFWGFQSQHVVPDIVTMGKPMGNGHPLAAVVTTREIAASLEKGVEYFNSFGGNPVSCEVGKAVLRVIEEEALQNNADDVGSKLKSQLSMLAQEYELFGDVRGLGLFLGIEIVKSRASKAPDASAASQIVEAMKSRGILLSTDGPDNNVIKIKPPLVFSRENASLLVSQLEEVISRI